jgi:hypothetical protein
MELPTVWSGTFPGHSAGYARRRQIHDWPGAVTRRTGGDTMVVAAMPRRAHGTATIGGENWPDPPWGMGVHWTGAVLLWGASTAYDLFARKDRRGRGTKLREPSLPTYRYDWLRAKDKDSASSVVLGCRLPGVA